MWRAVVAGLPHLYANSGIRHTYCRGELLGNESGDGLADGMVSEAEE